MEIYRVVWKLFLIFDSSFLKLNIDCVVFDLCGFINDVAIKNMFNL